MFDRYFPNMGVDEKGDLRDILRLLDDHVQSRYNSYKKAFLQLDVVREHYLFPSTLTVTCYT